MATKKITSFVINGLDGSDSDTIDNDNHTISLTVPSGTNLTSLTPTIEFLGSSVSPASGAAQDFSGGSVVYTVTALNGSQENYTVNISEELSEESSGESAVTLINRGKKQNLELDVNGLELSQKGKVRVNTVFLDSMRVGVKKVIRISNSSIKIILRLKKKKLPAGNYSVSFKYTTRGKKAALTKDFLSSEDLVAN